MKRVGNLWQHIVCWKNIREAYLLAVRGKHDRQEIQDFKVGLDRNLEKIGRDLRSESYQLGRHYRFVVHDPKRRIIHAPCFEERVIHHAVMRQCEPVLEKRSIYHSYACRKGKGQFAALEVVKTYARRYDWFLKGDIRKYFDSIAHDRLLRQLNRIFKDPQLMRFFEQLLSVYHTISGIGLPIGSLCSQHLANAYLGELDRWIESRFHGVGYVRYMDDFIVWSRCRDLLQELREILDEFLAEALGLVLKKRNPVFEGNRGADFLGYRVFPTGMRLNRRSRVRYRKRLRIYLENYSMGLWTERDFQVHVNALDAFTQRESVSKWKMDYLKQFGAAAIGHEPGQPRWQLEQQRQELPLSESQQEHAGQPQQQPWLPPGAHSSELTGNADGSGGTSASLKNRRRTEPAVVPHPERE